MNDAVSGNYRYVRISVTGSSKDWAAIREFKVFEKPAVPVSNQGLNPIARPAISILAAPRKGLLLSFAMSGPIGFSAKLRTLRGSRVLSHAGISDGARPNVAQVPLTGIAAGEYYIEVKAGRAALHHRIKVR